MDPVLTFAHIHEVLQQLDSNWYARHILHKSAPTIPGPEPHARSMALNVDDRDVEQLRTNSQNHSFASLVSAPYSDPSQLPWVDCGQ